MSRRSCSQRQTEGCQDPSQEQSKHDAHGTTEHMGLCRLTHDLLSCVFGTSISAASRTCGATNRDTARGTFGPTCDISSRASFNLVCWAPTPFAPLIVAIRQTGSQRPP